MQSLNTQLIILTLSILFSTIKLVRTASVGDSCVDNRRLNGFCKYIYDCPYVMRLKLGQRPYERCGHEDGREVVCCGERIRPPTLIPIDNSRRYVRECEKYKSEMFDKDIHFSTLTVNAPVRTISVSNCTRYTFPLVVEGENANPKEYPHMALIGCRNSNNKTEFKWICGGTLISPNFILTAAHCIESVVCDEITDVRIGELVIGTESDDAQPKDYEVERTITHPTYKDTIKYNDIALIKLKTNVEINEYRRPACLPYYFDTNTSQLHITGWGANESAGNFVMHLQKAAIEPFAQEECNKIYIDNDSEEDALPTGIRERVQICAGSYTTKKDTCQGDSGGPLQIVHPNHPCMYSVVGVTSAGQGCGTYGIPGLYTRVFHYIDWIESIVWD